MVSVCPVKTVIGDHVEVKVANPAAAKKRKKQSSDPCRPWGRPAGDGPVAASPSRRAGDSQRVACGDAATARAGR
jgi:hypothetical protein